MPDGTVMVALLAAGQGRRFGGGKLDVECAGMRLGAWAAQAAEQAGFHSRIVIVPEQCPDFARELHGWRVVTNEAADADVASSVRIAGREAHGHARLVIALADMPLVEATHLRALAAADGVAFTAYPEGGRGVPAAFPAESFETLKALKGSAARRDWGEGVTIVHPCNPQSLMDVDFPADLARVRAAIAAAMEF